MSAQPQRIDPASSLEITRQIDAVCDEFEVALGLGGDVAIDQYLGRVELPGRKATHRRVGITGFGSAARASRPGSNCRPFDSEPRVTRGTQRDIAKLRRRENGDFQRRFQPFGKTKRSKHLLPPLPLHDRYGR